MRRLVFFPTNNIGKYDRYKKSFEKEGIIYRRYLTSDDGADLRVDILEDGKTLKENAEKFISAFSFLLVQKSRSLWEYIIGMTGSR